MESENKVSVYLAISDEQKRGELEMMFMTNYLDMAIFPLANVAEYEQRLKLNPPKVVVVDEKFLAGNTILKDGATIAERAQTSYLVLGSPSDQEDYMDEVMVGKIQFFGAEPAEDDWKVAMKKAFKFSLDGNSVTYALKNIKMGELLMKVGDPAEKIYILKKGKLQAFHLNEQDQKIILGEINPGEFVGEMAYFNAEPRSASVLALENSELIEIPLIAFDRVIYQKPAWAMKLIETLSKRLKRHISK